MDWDTWNSGSGGTGYFNNAGGGGKFKFIDRIQNITDHSPDIVVIEGGRNDNGQTSAAMQGYAEALYDAIHTALPDVKIYVVGPLYDQSTTIVSGVISARDGIKAACLSRGIPFIDPLVSGQEWITGYRGSSTGNATLFTDADLVHFTPAGHKYVAHRIARGILDSAGW